VVGIASTLTFWLLAILGTIGAVQLRRKHRLTWPLVAMAPFVAVMAAATYGLVRLRMPLDVALLVLAAVPIERGISRVQRRRVTRLRPKPREPQSSPPSPA